MSLNKLSAQEANNAALGQLGSILELSTTAVSESIVAIQFLSDSVFTTLTPESVAYVGSSGGAGDNVGSTVFTAGMTIYGRWTGFQLASGSVIAYRG